MLKFNNNGFHFGVLIRFNEKKDIPLFNDVIPPNNLPYSIILFFIFRFTN